MQHLAEFNFQPGHEHEEHDTQRGEIGDFFVQQFRIADEGQMHQIDEGRAQDQAGQQLAQHGGLPQAHGDVTARFGGEDDDGEGKG